jgi:signal peptidase I
MSTENVEKEVVDTTITEMASGKSEHSGWELFRFVIIVIAIVVPVRLFIAQPFIVSGSSMVPTFEDKNYLIVDEISYRFNEPERGDVVIFRYPNDPKKFFIKRIIGLPNETIDIKDHEITITSAEHKDGFVLYEPYVKNQASGITHFELKDNEYFVMGDNRSASSDSRYWGALPKENIVGRAWLRLWPLRQLDAFPGKYTQIESEELEINNKK